jgi:NAD(P)-dependent dehydrogenase (short-subunit alcohol dehydrogenase family)
VQHILEMQVIAIAMDVRDPKAITAAADEVERKFGALPSIIVNNAAGNFINVILNIKVFEQYH